MKRIRLRSPSLLLRLEATAQVSWALTRLGKVAAGFRYSPPDSYRNRLVHQELARRCPIHQLAAELREKKRVCVHESIWHWELHKEA
jgi:hypothetical protein